MKRFYFYLMILVVFVTSCNNSETKKVATSNITVSKDTVDTIMAKPEQKQPLVNDTIIYESPIHVDTIINKYHISYTVQDNDEVIITNGGTVFAGREVLLEIKYDGKNILNRKIDRTDFSSYIPSKEIKNYSIYYFGLERVEKDNTLTFEVSVCIPDTDISYEFELNVSSNGSIQTKEIYLEIEEDM